MDCATFLKDFADALEIRQQLAGEDVLKASTWWDSTAALIFIAMADGHYGVIVAVDELVRAKTLNDLYSLVSAHA